MKSRSVAMVLPAFRHRHRQGDLGRGPAFTPALCCWAAIRMDH